MPTNAAIDSAFLAAILTPIIATPVATSVTKVSAIFLPRSVRVAAVLPDLTLANAAVVAVHVALVLAVALHVAMIIRVSRACAATGTRVAATNPARTAF